MILDPDNRRIYQDRARAYRAAGNVLQAYADERKAEELRDRQGPGADIATGPQCRRKNSLRKGSRAARNLALRCNSHTDKPAC